MAFYLVYGKLNTKFEKLWYQVRTRFEFDNVQTYFYIKKFMYYDYNMHDLIVHKYFLKFH